MNVYRPIAMITFKEGIRNRALHGITFLAFLLLLANQLICSMIMREVGKVAVDIALSTVAVAGLLLVLFVGINLLAKDLDRRTIYMVLSRPVSRAQYIAGKFLGMTMLLAVAVGILGSFALLSVFLVKMSYPGYVDRFSWALIILALIFIFFGLLLLMSISFLFSTLTSTSFVALVLTFVSYIIGHSMSDVKTLVESPDSVGIQVSPALKMVVTVAYYVLPNLSFFDIKTQAAHGISMPMNQVLYVLGYGIVYAALALLLAALLFKRREFP